MASVFMIVLTMIPPGHHIKDAEFHWYQRFAQYIGLLGNDKNFLL